MKGEIRTRLRKRRQRERQKKEIGCNEQNNNSARFFVNFFAAPAQLRREMAKF